MNGKTLIIRITILVTWTKEDCTYESRHVMSPEQLQAFTDRQEDSKQITITHKEIYFI